MVKIFFFVCQSSCLAKTLLEIMKKIVFIQELLHANMITQPTTVITEAPTLISVIIYLLNKLELHPTIKFLCGPIDSV